MAKVRSPYGISNFKTLVTDGNHYVDRTRYVEAMERMHSKYHFFRTQLADYLSHTDMVGYLLVVVGYEVKLVEKIQL